MTSDPLSGSIGDPQSLNKFGYVGGNPVNFYDPLGLDPPPPTWCGSGPSAGQCYIDYYRAYADRFIGASSALAGMVQVWLYTGEFSVDGANARGSDLGGFGGAGIPVATGTTGGVLINGNPSLFDFLPEMPQQCDFGPCLPGVSSPFQSPAATAPARKQIDQWLNRILNPRVPGTNWCGFGGAGNTHSRFDEACQRHDGCWDEVGWTATKNFFLIPRGKVREHVEQCDVQFCKEVSNAIPTSRRESATQFYLWHVPGLRCQ